MSPPVNAGDTDSIPGQGRFHVPCHGATRPVCLNCLSLHALDPMFCHKRSHCSEKSMHHNETVASALCNQRKHMRSNEDPVQPKNKSIIFKTDILKKHQFSSIQSLSRIQLFATPWTAACQGPLSITSSWSLFKLMSIELVMPSNHIILCHPLLLLPSIFPSIRVSSKELVLRIRWPKYWSFSFSIRPSNEYSGLISFKIDWLDLLAVHGTLKSLL